MISLDDKILEIQPLLNMINKEGVENTLKFLRILMPYKLNYYMKLVYEIQKELEDRNLENKKKDINSCVNTKCEICPDQEICDEFK